MAHHEQVSSHNERRRKAFACLPVSKSLSPLVKGTPREVRELPESLEYYQITVL